MTGVDPVADVRSRVERVEQEDRMRTTALECHGDVAPHRRRRDHQVLDTVSPGGAAVVDTAHSPAPSTGASSASSIARVRFNARLIINLSRCLPDSKVPRTRNPGCSEPHRPHSWGGNQRPPKRLTAAIREDRRRQASFALGRYPSPDQAVGWRPGPAAGRASWPAPAGPSTPSCAYRSAGS